MGGGTPKSKRCCGGTDSLGPGHHQRHGLVCGAGCNTKLVRKQLLWSVQQGAVVGSKEADLGHGLGHGTSTGGVAQLVVAGAKESAMRGGVGVGGVRTGGVCAAG